MFLFYRLSYLCCYSGLFSCFVLVVAVFDSSFRTEPVIYFLFLCWRSEEPNLPRPSAAGYHPHPFAILAMRWYTWGGYPETLC
jgi:hypothetical protein